MIPFTKFYHLQVSNFRISGLLGPAAEEPRAHGTCGARMPGAGGVGMGLSIFVSQNPSQIEVNQPVNCLGIL
jgi:hypothetical protein